jgi:hypothetical protein
VQETLASRIVLRCGEHDRMVSWVGEKYDEKIKARWLSGMNAIVELFVSPSGTVSILLTMPSGQTCRTAWGTFFEDMSLDHIITLRHGSSD